MTLVKKKPLLIFLLLSIAIGLALLSSTAFIFNKTSETQFCISCHSMSSAYEDYKQTIHFNNKHGVSAECSDCHIPKEPLDYLVTKIRASKDIYHEFISGKIDTQEKYDSHKLSMAETVWAQMKANDSSTCRSCHDFDRMDPLQQKSEAVTAHTGAKANNQTCIDCHKGIAHSLPTPKSDTQLISTTDIDDTVYATVITPIHNSANLEKSRAKILPLTKLTVLEKQQDKVLVTISGWKESRKKILYSEKGLRIAGSTLRGIKQITETGETYQDPVTKNVWKQIQIKGWIDDSPVIKNIESSWGKLKFEYDNKCGQCHLKVEEGHFTANDWPAQFMGMAKQAKLTKDETQAMLKYLQYHSSTFIKHN